MVETENYLMNLIKYEENKINLIIKQHISHVLIYNVLVTDENISFIYISRILVKMMLIHNAVTIYGFASLISLPHCNVLEYHLIKIINFWK